MSSMETLRISVFQLLRWDWCSVPPSPPGPWHCCPSSSPGWSRGPRLVSCGSCSSPCWVERSLRMMPANFQGKTTELLGAGNWNMRLLWYPCGSILLLSEVVPSGSCTRSVAGASIWESLTALSALRTPCNLCALFGTYSLSCGCMFKITVLCFQRHPAFWHLVQDGIA